MDDDLLRRIAADFNGVPGTGARAERSASLVADTNKRIADAAKALPFDSTPYAFPQWLAALDTSRRSK